MRKQVTITLNFNDEQDKMLEDIRWKHIDIDRLMQEEIEKESQMIAASIIASHSKEEEANA